MTPKQIIKILDSQLQDAYKENEKLKAALSQALSSLRSYDAKLADHIERQGKS